MNKIFNKLFLGLAVCGLAMTACSDGVSGSLLRFLPRVYKLIFMLITLI